jgi:phosphoglycerate dehydrogenase-like enzyme/predicted dehydrogenase
MTRLLLIGCGHIATRGHLPALAMLQREGLVDVVVCDADPVRAREAAARFGMEPVAGWPEVARDVDAAAICVPPGPNADLAAEAVEFGLHVLCEKPPGRTVAQADAMAAAAVERPDQVTMIGFNRRFNPLYREVMARSTSLGSPTSFYGRFFRAALGSPPSNTVSDWITSDSSHILDLAVATLGFPQHVGVSRRTVGSGPENVWTVQLHMHEGSAVLQLHYAAGRRTERYEWAGPGYDAALDLPDRAEWAQPDRRVEVLTVEEIAGSAAYHVAFGFEQEYRAFLGAIAGVNAPPACDFAYGADFMRLVQTLLEAPVGAVQPVPQRTVGRAAAPADTAEEPAPSSPVPPAKPEVLLLQPAAVQPRYFSVERLMELGQRCDVRTWAGDIDALETADVVVAGRGAVTLPPGRLQAAPDLALVVLLGASVRQLEPEALLDRGVTVCNTADAVAQSVAEHCLLLALAGLRRLTVTGQSMRRGGWPGPESGSTRPRSRGFVRRQLRRLPVPLGVKKRVWRLVRRFGETTASVREQGTIGGGLAGQSDLRGGVVGLIGWGHTARRFAQLLRPFDCELLVYSDAAPEAELDTVGARRASLGEILGSGKVISLHRGLTEHTRGFLGRRQLDQIRPGSVLVNTARAELVEETALLARLARGDIIAALDVFHEEPLPERHPLRRLDNVILTPHQASTTAQEDRRMGDHAIRTVLDWLGGLPVDGIDPARLSRMT